MTESGIEYWRAKCKRQEREILKLSEMLADTRHEASQMERIKIAGDLLSSIWQEFEDGKIDREIGQIAVYCQTDINRILWKLNKLMQMAEREEE